MRMDKTYKGCQHFEGVMSLPPAPPLSTSSYHLIFNYFCPNIGGNYKYPLSTTSPKTELLEKQPLQLAIPKSIHFELIELLLMPSPAYSPSI